MIAILLRVVLLICIGAAQAGTMPEAPVRPKLVLVLVVDGLPQEQVQRYRAQLGPGGLRRLLDQGAWYSNAHQAHGITVTTPGHAAILTGAYPYQHGIIGNSWIDPDSGAPVYCTEDARYTYLDEATHAGDGTSPARLRVPTVGDELRYASGGRSKVVTVSGKDRGAILLAGKSGTAYMYMDGSGNFATSTYYMQAYPDWARRYRATRPQERYRGATWQALLPPDAYRDDADAALAPLKPGTGAGFPLAVGSAHDADLYAALKTSPFLDQLTFDFARAAVLGEHLGDNPAGVPDLLAVSLSAHDYINHTYGPESRFSHDHLQRLDRMLAAFFDFLDQRVGLANVLVVFTADHGFTNVPEFSQARHLDAARLDGDRLAAALGKHLADKFALEALVKKSSLPNIYLDYALAERRGVRREDLENAAARFLLAQDGVAQVYTRGQFEHGGAGATRIDLLMRRAWNRQLSGDLLVVLKPFWFFSAGATGSSHGSPYAYDTNVPLMLMGPRWIRPGAYGQYAEVVDLASTLAHLLRLRPPAGAEGRVLTEALR